MSNLVLPSSDLVATQTTQFTEVPKHGPFIIGEAVPWKGITFKVEHIVSNEYGDFRMILKPVAVTSKQVKRMSGKKGKRG